MTPRAVILLAASNAVNPGGRRTPAPGARRQATTAAIVSAPRARATDTRWWPSRIA